MFQEERENRIGRSPFKEQDFVEALCCGPLCELLERVLEAANKRYDEWHFPTAQVRAFVLVQNEISEAHLR